MREALESLEVAVVGAGPAGIGIACALTDAGVPDFVVLERERIGASLLSWPAEMRCVTPSFQANAFGAVDLNAVSPSTSPAFSFEVEHPSGAQWAQYLAGVAVHFGLPVREGVDAKRVHALGGEDGFALETSHGTVRARCLVWAAGEFGAPRIDLFPGAELCRPVGRVGSWAQLRDRDVVVIGGYESGIDAAVSLLARSDRRVTVIDAQAPWERRHGDPSVTLSPYTRERLESAWATGRLKLVGATDATRVACERPGRFQLDCSDGSELALRAAPLLAGGYRPVLGPVAHLLECDKRGMPTLDEHDQSTVTPGLFLAGPMLRHRDLIFCFAYKYRGRFPVVAAAIAAGLGCEPASGLSAWRSAGMYLDDLSCCDQECSC